MAADNSLMAITLQAGVPLRIMEMESYGGPRQDDIEFAREYSSVLGSKGDVLLFGSKKKGEAAGLMNGLIKAVAVLSFCPGGVRLFGCHFEGRREVMGVEKVKSWGDSSVDEKLDLLRRELRKVRRDTDDNQSQLAAHRHMPDGTVVEPVHGPSLKSDPLA